MLAPYRRVFRIPGFTLPYLLGIAITFALGSVGLGLLLAVEDRTGSLARAGFVAGAFGFGNALGIFAQGRLIDRFGQPRVLVPAAISCGLCLAVTVLPGPDVGYVVPSAAALAGVAFPATISSMRVLISALIEDEQVRMSAYALLAVSFSLAMVTGPLIVSAAVLLADPSAAVLMAAALIGSGGVAFALTPAARGWTAVSTQEGSASARPRLLSAGMVTLLVASTATGFAGGIGNVALPAAVLAHGPEALTGVAFALAAAGDLIGGLVYGAIRWSPPRATQLAVALGLDAVFGWAIAGASGALVALFILMFAGSVLVAVTPIASSAILDEVAPQGSLTTAYTAIVGCGLVAGSAGNAIAGTVAQHYGPAAAYCLAAAAVTAAAVWVATRRGTLHRPAASRIPAGTGDIGRVR